MSCFKLSVDDCYSLLSNKNPEPSEKFLDGQWDSYCGLTPSLEDWSDPEYREGYRDYCSVEQLQYLNQKYDLD